MVHLSFLSCLDDDSQNIISASRQCVAEREDEEEGRSLCVGVGFCLLGVLFL